MTWRRAGRLPVPEVALTGARELPTVFPECRALVAALVADDAPVAA